MPTWFLPPDFTFSADNGPLQLGTVIAHPKHPTFVLAALGRKSGGNSSGIALPATNVVTEEGHTHSASHSRSNGFGIWSTFFGLASAKVKTEVGDHAKIGYSKVDHEVRSFAEPLTPEIASAIEQLPAVKAFIDDGTWGKRPVYVVSGLRVAKTSFTVSKEVGAKFKAEVGGSGPSPAVAMGIPLEIGGSVTHDYESKVTDSYKTAPGIVFAYQLHVIRHLRRGVETKMFQSKTAFMTGTGGDGDGDGPLLVVDATTEELDQDMEEEDDYTKSTVGDDVCISY